MRYIRYIICAILIAIITSQVAFALTTTKGKILENFKLQEKEMIFESETILDDEDRRILSTYRKLGIYSSIGAKVKAKREELEAQSEKIKSRRNSLEASIQQFDEDIEEVIKEIGVINAQIVEVKKQVQATKATIDLLKEKIEANTEVLLEYMVYLYKKGEYVSSKNDIDNLKTILLSGERIDELVNDLYFKSIMQVTGQQLVDKHRGYVSKMYVKKLELEKSEQQLKDLRKIGVLEKNTLDDKRGAKERLLEITKGQEDLYQKYILEQLAIERDVKVKELREEVELNNSRDKLLEKYGCEFVDIKVDLVEAAKLSDKCLEVNRIIFAESRIANNEVVKNPLKWPVSPYGGISAYFSDEGYVAELGTDHDAIDIVVPQGTEIKAPMDGYVIYVQPPVNTGYSYFAVKHSDGLVTLYGHVTKIYVEKNDFVREGEVIALSGGSYGTKGAGVLSSGAHLHFVVYENQEYRDPLEYLDLSYLNYNDLSVRYQYKYLDDFKARKGVEYENKDRTTAGAFRIEGDGEIERQKYLLSTYAVGGFRDWDLWVEEGVSANIDPTFLMCVGLAETTLGKYMKTPNNIGNVGNTDSGATITFPSPRSGLHSMAKAFNNRYLSQYDEIQELSRYGNKDLTKPIYASSDFNWHNNITKCMSHVKGEYIPDDYEFRSAE